MSTFYIQIFSEENSIYSIIVEDDGLVAYCYLIYKDEIIGDVWFYNQADPPLIADWSNKDGMPYLNPQEFVELKIEPIRSTDDLDVHWHYYDDQLNRVEIFLRKQLAVVLKPNSKPGWSTFVNKDNPIAKKYVK
jgi:hypothetical protein